MHYNYVHSFTTQSTEKKTTYVVGKQNQNQITMKILELPKNRRTLYRAHCPGREVILNRIFYRAYCQGGKVILSPSSNRRILYRAHCQGREVILNPSSKDILIRATIMCGGATSTYCTCLDENSKGCTWVLLDISL